ncbi:dTDP-4-amino-4,6-dideoxygalactose transaminase [Geothrix sp. 21YS21S-2]|uniref:dTDP-4-amino-4,6-dideoxygalactose transaminase n=1 Tax=Geothrix sp. 21YS21S-2 TaxID=3068893 RepID=UPI0027BAE1DE|nr:dTDP-4-amino-4,6-dideoxygalactose transaminase [Geothrix sp. 21YS21S-2]
MIPFNRPHFTGREVELIQQVFESGRTSGNFAFTRRCQAFFEQRYGLRKALLTTSCTDALELAALACGIDPGDEVILASYGFVSTANAFALRGARLIFADSGPDHPNMAVASIADRVTEATRAIVVTHYAGVAVDMDPLLALADVRGIRVIEDAAQGVEATYKGRPLGSLGHLGALSFHETKNIQCGEGGLLMINAAELAARAEIMWEKGTNRAAFFRGEVDKYTWVDLGSSFSPPEITAAVLWAQLVDLDAIQVRRMEVWNRYHAALAPLEAAGHALLPRIPAHCVHNGHIYYLVLDSLATRTRLIEHLKAHGVNAVFHYQSLHRSPYFAPRHHGGPLPNSDRYSDCLLRLPLWPDLGPADQDAIIGAVAGFFGA